MARSALIGCLAAFWFSVKIRWKYQGPSCLMVWLKENPHRSVTAGSFLRQTAVVIPALNEELCAGEVVRQWLALGVRRVRVVDNGSSDATARVAAAAGAEVITEPRCGYGAAAWRGLQAWPADCEWVLFSSADGSDRLASEEVAAWQRAVEMDADMILGERVSLASSSRHLKPPQRFGNWLCCAVIAAGWGRRFRDMASLRLARHEALLQLRLADRGFGWNVEMQVRALEAGWRITELPVGYFPRSAGESKISGSWRGTIRAGHGILRMIFQLWLRHRHRPPRSATAPAPASARV
jgi:glycosyltransferase involved in cell wall biosynthesis